MVTCGRSLSRLLVWAIVLVFVLAALGMMAGCGGDEGDGGGGGGGEAESVIEVVGVDGTKTYTLDEIKDMESTEGYAGIKSSTGRITPPAMFKGVSLDTLFAEVGGLPEDMAVELSATLR